MQDREWTLTQIFNHYAGAQISDGLMDCQEMMQMCEDFHIVGQVAESVLHRVFHELLGENHGEAAEICYTEFIEGLGRIAILLFPPQSSRLVRELIGEYRTDFDPNFAQKELENNPSLLMSAESIAKAANQIMSLRHPWSVQPRSRERKMKRPLKPRFYRMVKDKTRKVGKPRRGPTLTNLSVMLKQPTRKQSWVYQCLPRAKTPDKKGKISLVHPTGGVNANNWVIVNGHYMTKRRAYLLGYIEKAASNVESDFQPVGRNSIIMNISTSVRERALNYANRVKPPGYKEYRKRVNKCQRSIDSNHKQPNSAPHFYISGGGSDVTDVFNCGMFNPTDNSNSELTKNQSLEGYLNTKVDRTPYNPGFWSLKAKSWTPEAPKLGADRINKKSTIGNAGSTILLANVQNVFDASEEALQEPHSNTAPHNDFICCSESNRPLLWHQSKSRGLQPFHVDGVQGNSTKASDHNNQGSWDKDCNNTAKRNGEQQLLEQQQQSISTSISHFQHTIETPQNETLATSSASGDDEITQDQGTTEVQEQRRNTADALMALSDNTQEASLIVKQSRGSSSSSSSSILSGDLYRIESRSSGESSSHESFASSQFWLDGVVQHHRSRSWTNGTIHSVKAGTRVNRSHTPLTNCDSLEHPPFIYEEYQVGEKNMIPGRKVVNRECKWR